VRPIRGPYLRMTVALVGRVFLARFLGLVPPVSAADGIIWTSSSRHLRAGSSCHQASHDTDARQVEVGPLTPSPT
jgi:hypothetical protein